MIFNSKVQFRGFFLPKNFQASQERIKNEPMLFNCDLKSAYELGGPLTRSFIDNLPLDWLEANPVIDSRVHLLMPGWYPCIPGWHHDDVPRSTSTGQPNYVNPEYESEHICGLVNAEICPTKFLIGDVEVSEPNIHKTVYEEWDREISENYVSEGSRIPRKVNHDIYLAESNRLIQFDNHTFHEGTKAVGNGWRWFIRASRNTDRQKTVTNELRHQTQVYLEYPKAGW